MNDNEHNLPADFDDLSNHAPLLEKIRAKGECFVVPSNYFNELAERIISIVQLSFTDNRQLTTDNCFIVPEGYFEKLADEIISVSQLADLKTESFKIPDAYFSELDETIATKLALDNLKQDEGFSVPENYFDKFADKVLTHIAVDELGKGSDADVPPGYFDALADRIAERIADEESVEPEKAAERGRIIVFAEVLKRYARPISVAASVTLILGVSIWFFNREKEKIEIADVKPPKQNIQPVIPVPKKDAMLEIIQPENNIVEQPKIKKTKPVNLPKQAVVKQPDSKDILEQLHLLDENMIADYIIETNREIETPKQEESLNDEMRNYLLDTNFDPSDIK